MKKIAVVGAGSWGTALAVMLEQDGHDVTMWARNTEAVENMKKTRENKQYLTSLQMQKKQFQKKKLLFLLCLLVQ